MTFVKSKLPGVFEIHLEPKADERGFFARTWCQKEFESNGLNPKLVQCSISFNARKGTLRGMHYQAAATMRRPNWCAAPGVQSTTWSSISVRNRRRSRTGSRVVLTAENRNMIYVPEGCAHGFLTLEDETEVFYQMSEFYNAESARGVRWNDPAFQIAWPEKVEVISERDRTYPNFE